MLAAAAAAIGEAQGSAQSAGPKTVGPTSSPILPDAQAEPFEVPVVQPGPGAETPEEIRLLSDVNLDVTIELGRTRMLVEDVLRLGSGAVVELDKLAGDPVDVYINGRHVARGEVLVLNDNFCVRVSEIVSADETVPET
ncbi:MAG: flagellar motor switch protein FliN [Planctomycetota bacterium]|nr:MAG: flagellar motor switch protein FliN [Planctomycetota bacterium]